MYWTLFELPYIEFWTSLYLFVHFFSIFVHLFAPLCTYLRLSLFVLLFNSLHFCAQLCNSMCSLMWKAWNRENGTIETTRQADRLKKGKKYHLKWRDRQTGQKSDKTNLIKPALRFPGLKRIASMILGPQWSILVPRPQFSRVLKLLKLILESKMAL